MTLSMKEKKILYAYGCPSHHNTVTRLKWLTALTVDPEAKEAKVVAIWKDGKLVDEITDGEEAGIILDKTPFYAEGGGQVGDEGMLLGEFGRMGHCRPELPFGVVAHLYCEMSHAPVYKFFCFLTFHSSVMFWTKSSFVAHLSGSNAQAPVS